MFSEGSFVNIWLNRIVWTEQKSNNGLETKKKPFWRSCVRLWLGQKVWTHISVKDVMGIYFVFVDPCPTFTISGVTIYGGWDERVVDIILNNGNNLSPCIKKQWWYKKGAGTLLDLEDKECKLETLLSLHHLPYIKNHQGNGAYYYVKMLSFQQNLLPSREG